MSNGDYDIGDLFNECTSACKEETTTLDASMEFASCLMDCEDELFDDIDRIGSNSSYLSFGFFVLAYVVLCIVWKKNYKKKFI